ncbi:vang-like protein 1 [Diorhabda carinulata]|uniref:vang-like protein 1 n=1 Tax=Diorhabda sublineata TaxID=1163346 RepID=UPI0024E113F0|nr:vang-like protein 1 [Diorhabda sublineata]XP_057671133.1 vang-like protein 1 [Diorhabda carinulata]XP_057671138.1 vang-like protein 1 [Diorhabda carinulata]
MGNETARDMETESVKSENSSKSRRSRSHRDRTSNYRHHSHRSTRSSKSRRNEDMAPFQTAVTLTPDNRDGQEIIEVQILPQDDNWGENTTAITGNTSEQSGSAEDVCNWPGEPDTGLGFVCQRYMGTSITYILSIAAFLSPIAMVVLPKVGFFPDLSARIGLDSSKLLSCGAECKGLLVSLAFKMAILAIGAWAVFLRKPQATLPRFFLFRAGILALVLVCTFAYWLFYIVQVTETARAAAIPEETVDYKALVAYASSLTDTLLFIHYLAIVLVEIRHLQPTYCIKIVRSPDGASNAYAIGQLSIQRAAVWVLEKYYTEFPIYNPYLERIPVSKSRKTSSSFKFYEVDGVNPSQIQQSQSRAMLAAHARRRDSSHNERFYEEHEYERRVKKRRARLITAAEEAFTHIKRLHNDQISSIPMDSHEAAQAIFPSMARALQKYLRVTRQQPRHSVESILNHLATCLSNDLTPKAFLEPYLVAEPVLQNDKEKKEVQTWALICEEILTRPIRDGVVFQLRQNDVSILCNIKKLPHFNVTEEVVDPKSNKFVLRLNSETSV